MPSIRFRLEQPTLRGLEERVRAEYGPDARVVDTEESLTGGLGGFFAKRVIDVTIELPDPVVPSTAHSFDAAARVGLARLLEEAEREEAEAPRTEHPVSTESIDFARVLDGLKADVNSPRPPATPAARPAWAFEPVSPPVPPRGTPPPATAGAPVLPGPTTGGAPVPPGPGRPEMPGAAAGGGPVLPGPGRRLAPPLPVQPGDLIVVAGLGEDSLVVAHALARSLARAHVCDGGSVLGHTRRRVEDRRGAHAARAYGVQSGQTVVVAYGLGDGNPSDPRIAALPAIGADQVWVAVDASRKTVDTARWVNAVRAGVEVAALATLAGRFTTSRESVVELGLPEGWSDRPGERVPGGPLG